MPYKVISGIITVLLLLIIIANVTRGWQARKRKKDRAELAEANLQGETITVGIDTLFQPMSFLTEERQPSGFDLEFMVAAATPMEVNLKIRGVDWDKKEELLASGEVDCLWSGVSVTESRKKAFRFSHPYLSTRIVLLSQLEDAQVKAVEDLRNFEIGVQRASSAEEKLREALGCEPDDNLPETVLLYDNYAEALDAMDRGTVQLCAIDESFYFYAMEVNRQSDASLWPQYFVSPFVLGEESYAVAFRKDAGRLCGKLNAAMKELKKEGKLQELSERWFGMDLTTTAGIRYNEEAEEA